MNGGALTLENPVAGFAHGAAGVASALALLWDVTGDGRYRDAALEAVAFEDEAYDPGAGNWRSRRDHSPAEQLHDQWCRGRSGIGLSRLGIAECLADGRVTAGLERALAGTPTDGVGEDDQLCCGDAPPCPAVGVTPASGPGDGRRWTGRRRRHQEN